MDIVSGGLPDDPLDAGSITRRTAVMMDSEALTTGLTRPHTHCATLCQESPG